MKKFQLPIIIVTLLVLVAGAIFLLSKILKPKGAGILIDSNPAATVFINGEQAGRTPHEDTYEPGEMVVKLIPESIDTPLAPFETKVNITSGIKTIINREFGETTDSSGGFIVSFEKVGGKEVSISVVSIPDAAQVSIDGSVRGFAPYKTSSISAGEHQVVVASTGYKDRELKIKAVKGYKLTAVVKLIPLGDELTRPDESGEAEGPKEEMVEILDTPTGFLRVRSGSSTADEEIDQVEPGEQYKLLGEDEVSGWFKIEYLPAQAGEEGKEGWISNQYAEKVTDETSTPTPTEEPEGTPTEEPGSESEEE